MTQYCQRNPEDKNKLRGITLPRLQAILQSNSLQNNVVHINFNINGSSSIKKNVRAYDDKDCIKPVDFLGLWLF